MAEEWRQCLDWLNRCKVLPKDYIPRDVSDLALILRDGVILCYLINVLKPGALDVSQIQQRPNMMQFSCIKNIKYFLQACRTHLRMRESDLFDAEELWDLSDFSKVMYCLSQVSKTEIAERTGIPGFQHEKEENIYRNLEDLEAFSRELPDEKLHGAFGTISVLNEEDENVCQNLCYRPPIRNSTRRTEKSEVDYCLDELLNTEKDYVDVLKTIVEKFMKPLEINILTPHQMKTVFLNTELLYKTHIDISKSLQSAINRGIGSIADVFIKNKKCFTRYADYHSGLTLAQATLDEIMLKNGIAKHTIADCEHRANGGKFKLRDLLVVPIKRVMKYSLLLHELKKNLEKEGIFEKDSDEIKTLEKAMQCMQDVAHFVNEYKRDKESLDAISQLEKSIQDLSMPEGTHLEDYGHLLKDGDLEVKFHDDSNSENKRYVFLFDKVMLMCTSKGDVYSYENALIMNNFKLDDGTRGTIKGKHSFMLVEKDSKTAITFYCKTEEQKNKWMNSIKIAMENFFPSDAKSNGYDFMMHTFVGAQECDFCCQFLSGCFYQGYLCSITKTKAHKECIRNLVTRQPSKKRFQVKASNAYHGFPPPPQGAILRFNEGEIINVLNSDNPHWWLGCKASVPHAQGYFPASSVRKLPTADIRPSRGRIDSVMRPTPSPPPASQIYVNDLTSYPWYIGTYNKNEASVKLNNQADGVFLVRESKDRPGEYALGVAYKGAAKHIKIERGGPDSKWYIADSRYFSSIPELISFYEKHSLQDSFTELTTALITPFNSIGSSRRAVSSTLPRWSMTASDQSLDHRRPSPRMRASSVQSLSSSPKPSVRNSMPPIIGKAIVQYDFSPKEPNQITLRCGDKVVITSKAGGDKGWWKGAVLNRNQQPDTFGYFPLAYVEEMEDDDEVNR